MSHISIQCFHQHEQRTKSKYHRSYRASIDTQERYLCDYYLRPSLAQEAEIIDEQDASQSLHIKQEKKHGVVVTAIASADRKNIWYLHDMQLLNHESQPIVLLNEQSDAHDVLRMTTPNRQVLLATSTQPQPIQADFLDSIKAMFGRNDTPDELYRIHIKHWPLNPALLIAVTLITFHKAGLNQ